MLKILLKKQLYELNSSFFYDRKQGKARAKSTSILFIVLYALLMIVVIGGMFAAKILVVDRALKAVYDQQLVARVTNSDLWLAAPFVVLVGVVVAAITAQVTLRWYVKN